MNSSPTSPTPPPTLRYKVAGSEDAEGFDRGGSLSVRDYEAALASVGETRGLDGFDRALDFGCGCGRMLRWLDGSKSSLSGCDIEQDLVDWASRNVPGVSFSRTSPLPPLPYADGLFNLVYSHSVFTHVDRDYQDKWLSELDRVAAPGAILLLSVNGDKSWSGFDDGSDLFKERREARDRDGLIFITDDNWAKDKLFPDFYHSTFHTERYVRSHWSGWFDVSGYVKAGALGLQDIVVCRKKES
jgi:SAM-dependent methyltransferase